MSKDIAHISGKYKLTSFYGGVDKGACLQITCLQPDGVIQLEAKEVIELIYHLSKWVKEVEERNAQVIEKLD